ncbi:MAG: LPXTG cell wall anchor domain-containing protein [Bombilactobacillus mellifer]|nr:LPXTG cell wall anchor domain-containing protein [Bombilactobacillus mellifer]
MIYKKKASIRMRLIIIVGTLIFGLTVFTVSHSSFAKSLIDGGEATTSANYSVQNKESVALVKVDNTKHYQPPKTDEVPKTPESGPVHVQNASYGNLPQTSDAVQRYLPLVGAMLIVGSFGLLVTKKKFNLL